MASRYLAATAITALLTFGAGYPTFAQSTSGSDEPTTEADCPEDMDNEPGCGNDAPVSERQPVEGAVTAPVEPEMGDSGTTSIAEPEDTAPAQDTSGSGSSEDALSSDGDESSSGSDSGASESDSDNAEESEDASAAPVEGDPNIAVAYEEGGRYFTADDIPTYNISESGEVGWLTYSGFRRYHSECHVCHGPDGEGSSYAPALKDSAVNMDYYDFYNVVVNGIENVGASENSVMPAFGNNQNVMCYLDDIYVYLKARGTGAVPRGRPAEKEAKSDMIQEAEDACMGM